MRRGDWTMAVRILAAQQEQPIFVRQYHVRNSPDAVANYVVQEDDEGNSISPHLRSSALVAAYLERCQKHNAQLQALFGHGIVWKYVHGDNVIAIT